MSIHFADLLFYTRNGLKPPLHPPHFRNGLKPLAHKSVMATSFVRGMTFTSRVATADVNRLKKTHS